MAEYIGAVVAVALFLFGGVAYLVRGWFNHVNQSIEDIWERLQDEQQAREQRWQTLFNHCREHGEKLARVEGKLNGMK